LHHLIHVQRVFPHAPDPVVLEDHRPEPGREPDSAQVLAFRAQYVPGVPEPEEMVLGREALEPEATAVVAMHPYVRGREGPEVTLRLRFAHDHVRHALGVLRRNRAGGYLEVDQASHESNGVSVTELLRRTRDRGRRLALSENPERVRKRPV